MELRLPLEMSPGREAACRAVFGTWGFFRTMHGKTAASSRKRRQHKVGGQGRLVGDCGGREATDSMLAPRVAQEDRHSLPNFILYFNDFLEFYVLNITCNLTCVLNFQYKICLCITQWNHCNSRCLRSQDSTGWLPAYLPKTLCILV